MYRKNIASQTIGFVAINASTGATMTGTTGFVAYRCLDGAAQASATGTVTDKGNGQYSFALSQADTNGNDCSILFTMTGMVAVEKTFVTTAADPTSSTNFGLSALPTASPAATGGLLTVGTGSGQLTPSSGNVVLAAVTHTGAVIPTVTTVTNQLAAAAIATGVWQDATAGDFTVASSIGKALFVSAAPGAAGGHFIAGTNAATTVTTSFTTTFTGNLTGSVGSVTGAVGSVTGAVGSVAGSVGSVTAAVTLPSIPSNWITAAGINASALNGKGDWLLSSGYTAPPSAASIATSVLTTAMTESYSTVGGTTTLAQFAYMTQQRLTDFVDSGTTITIRKVDHTTTAATLTLDSSTAPTTSTRAT